jgi:RNA polymerase sigma-70 factor (ECF subfamily)
MTHSDGVRPPPGRVGEEPMGATEFDASFTADLPRLRRRLLALTCDARRARH